MINRNKELDVLKGIAIVIMVMGHAGFGSFFDSYKSAFNMPIFFLISGYLYNPSKYKNFKEFVLKKFRTIMVPYISFATITIIILVCINISSGFIVYPASIILRGLIWSNRGFFPITGAIWYLQCIFILEAIYYFCNKYMKKYQLLITIGMIALSALMKINFISLPFATDSAIGAYLFYHLGFKIKENIECVKPYLYSKNILIVIVIFFLNIFLIRINGYVNPRTCDYGIYPLFYINAIIGAWLYLNIAKIICTKNHKLICALSRHLAFVGMESITFMGINQLILNLFYTMVSYLFVVNNSIEKIMRNMLYFFLAYAVICLISLIIKNTKLNYLIGRE